MRACTYVCMYVCMHVCVGLLEWLRDCGPASPTIAVSQYRVQEWPEGVFSTHQNSGILKKQALVMSMKFEQGQAGEEQTLLSCYSYRRSLHVAQI